MTCICAIKRDGEIWIGADSMSSSSELISIGEEDHNKLVKFKNFIVAECGSWTLRDSLELVREKSPNIKMKTKSDARNFAIRVRKKLNDLIGTVYSNPKEESLSSGIIIATKTHIFDVQADLSIMDCNRYAVKGCGWTYCMGSMESLYGMVTPEEAIKRSIATACKLSPNCGEPVVIRKVS